MATQMIPTATPSQYASAMSHLDRRDDWRIYRFDGVRYVVLVSGCSGKSYSVRADAQGCSCMWYERTLGQCSHMLAVYLAATLDEMEAEAAEKPPIVTLDIRDERIELTEAGQALVTRTRPSYADLFPSCWTAGCDNDPEPHSGGCHLHSNADVF